MALTRSCRRYWLWSIFSTVLTLVAAIPLYCLMSPLRTPRPVICTGTTLLIPRDTVGLHYKLELDTLSCYDGKVVNLRYNYQNVLVDDLTNTTLAAAITEQYRIGVEYWVTDCGHYWLTPDTDNCTFWWSYISATLAVGGAFFGLLWLPFFMTYIPGMGYRITPCCPDEVDYVGDEEEEAETDSEKEALTADTYA